MAQDRQEGCLSFDLIIRNGRVLDPASGLDIIADVGVKSRRISSVVPHLEGISGLEEFDASGCIVTAGLIDSHVHVYQHATPLGIDVDETCLARGVTTVVDAGSAGRCNASGKSPVFDIGESELRAASKNIPTDDTIQMIDIDKKPQLLIQVIFWSK
ncbi:hypothetical protein OS493_007172 [Desmophyllum pertusum]|uniref:Dihydroorotase n=1 Tax=Desmophyllum pertusum TaxID=174260 RepID=A0A9X0CZ11_9CNID|nr:hypothetical protein OS493_007172 [Desmophyllum pertusum]